MGILDIAVITPWTCPQCGRDSDNRSSVVIKDNLNVTLWEGCLACWAELLRDLPDKVKLLQENARLRAMLTKVGMDADA